MNTTNSDSELPVDVLSAIGANRKIEAIKLLREERGLGLKEARQMVDAYISENPSPVTGSATREDSGIGRLVLFCLVAGLAYIGYRFVS